MCLRPVQAAVYTNIVEFYLILAQFTRSRCLSTDASHCCRQYANIADCTLDQFPDQPVQ